MTRAFVSLTKSTAIGRDGRPVMKIGGGSAPVVVASTTAYDAAATTYVTDAATFAAALATLVADGASPTQAHVTAANNAYTTLAADYTALAAAYTTLKASITALAAEGGDVYMSFDTAKVVSTTDLLAALDKLQAAVLNSHLVTAS